MMRKKSNTPGLDCAIALAEAFKKYQELGKELEPINASAGFPRSKLGTIHFLRRRAVCKVKVPGDDGQAYANITSLRQLSFMGNIFLSKELTIDFREVFSDLFFFIWAPEFSELISVGFDIKQLISIQ
jgi:hypothetical protein